MSPGLGRYFLLKQEACVCLFVCDVCPGSVPEVQCIIIVLLLLLSLIWSSHTRQLRSRKAQHLLSGWTMPALMISKMTCQVYVALWSQSTTVGWVDGEYYHHCRGGKTISPKTKDDSGARSTNFYSNFHSLTIIFLKKGTHAP